MESKHYTLYKLNLQFDCIKNNTILFSYDAYLFELFSIVGNINAIFCNSKWFSNVLF